ncbi:tyrosine-type recombinase/integrase [Pediococcus acidilactici]
MHFEKRKYKDGESFFVAVERYVDPLTGKRKRATLIYHSDSARGRRQAERDLANKIENTIAKKQGAFDISVLRTFGDLKASWYETWQTTVKPQTIKREDFIIRRLSKIVSDDILLTSITPLLVQNCLNEYRKRYNSSFATIQHIKSTFNKIFDHGISHNVLRYSPSRVIRMTASVTERQNKRKRLEDKFLNAQEVSALLSELKLCRHQTYYDLALFLIGTGCRIGEASALTINDIDFRHKQVRIDKSLQYHDLRVDEYYLDTTKTPAGERTEQLPEFAIKALHRVIERNKFFDKHQLQVPSKMFHQNDFLFKTEYGSSITSGSFREILARINRKLRTICPEKYGFIWRKNAVPHSFRHIHISVLRNDPNVSLKEVQTRVGHVLPETTNLYTHLLSNSQDNSVKAISKFIDHVS